jgi:hypothetical protein
MKKLLVIAFLLAGSIIYAQTASQSGPSVRLNGYTTYAFADNHVDSYYSDTQYFEGSIEGGFEYGGGLEVLPAPYIGVEFTYLRLDTKAPLEYYDNAIKFTTFNLASNYLFLGFNKYVNLNPKVEPYAGLMLGMAIYNVENPENSNTGSATKFAWGLKAGSNIWVNERVGLKLQAQLLSAVQAIGGGVYFGTGGAGAGVSGFSTYYQFNLGGGLVFRLGGR